jgi:hypothetical protein
MYAQMLTVAPGRAEIKQRTSVISHNDRGQGRRDKEDEKNRLNRQRPQSYIRACVPVVSVQALLRKEPADSFGCSAVAWTLGDWPRAALSPAGVQWSFRVVLQ